MPTTSMDSVSPTTNLYPDQIANTDSIGRKNFAKRITANVITHLKTSNESLVVGIHGPWGSGKSTLLHYIKEEVQPFESGVKEEGLITRIIKHGKVQSDCLYKMEFNPWMFSGREELQSIFLNEFALKIGNKNHQLRESVRSLSKGFKWLKNLGGIGAAAEEAISEASKISISKLKDETNRILSENNIKVVIFIDDLDRLAPNEILEIFQLVKLNANFSNTVFIISFDKSVVKESIKTLYDLDGEKYLEKIVQVDYGLPSILDEDIEAIFFARLEAFLGQHEIEFESKNIYGPWLVHGLKYYFRNIRDLNRYFNSISFRLPAFHKEVNVHDFLLIEAIRLFDFNSYEIARMYYKAGADLGKNSPFKGVFEKFSENSKPLFNYLFDKQRTKENYSIHDPEFFERYFSLSVSKKDLRKEEFENFIKLKETRYALLDNLIKNGKIEFLLRRLSTSSALPPNTDLSEVASSLISVWTSHVEEFPKYWRIVWNALTTVSLTKSDPTTGIRNLITELSSYGSSDFNPASFVFTWLLLENITKEDDKNLDKDLEPFSELLESRKESLESNWKNMLQNQLSRFFMSNEMDTLYQYIFFPAFAKCYPEQYINQLRSLVSDDQRALRILRMLVYVDTSTKEPVGINTQKVAQLIPDSFRAEMIKVLSKIKPKALIKSDAKVVDVLSKYLRGEEAFPAK